VIKIVLLNEGLNRIRTLIGDDVSQGQVGSGTALPSPTDSTLVTPIATTLVNVDSVTANTDKTINVQYTVPSTKANGSALNELEITLSNGDTALRKVYETIDKDNTKEVRFFTSLFVSQRK
jgi:hypothetical protein